MRGQSLKNLVESNGVEWTMHRLDQALTLGRRNDPEGLKSDDFSIRELAEAFLGEDWVRSLNPAYENQQRRQGWSQYGRRTQALYEAGDAVDVSAFKDITGQILFNKILQGWELADMVGDQICETVSSTLDGEKLPWISPPLTEGGKVHPGNPYQEYGMTQEYINTQPLNTYGAILSLHKLTVFYDRTGNLLKEASNLGRQLRYNKERRILNPLVQAATAPLFNWKGVSYTPFQAAGTYWTNLLPNVPLVDWASIEKVEIQATQTLEPDLLNTGINTPININLDTILVMPSKKVTAKRIITATEIRGYNLGNIPNTVTIGPDVLNSYKVIDSKLLFQQALATGATVQQASDWWWMFDSKTRPIVYMENWPLQLVPAPPNNIADFERDIVFRLKASERGEPSWQDPRMIFWMRNTSANGG